MLKLWKGLNSWSLDQVAGTLKENPYWGFWGCGLMMERYRFLPKAALFAAASFLPSPSSWFATPAGEVLTWLFGEHQPHLRSPGWIAARPCANLQRHPAAASLLWDSLHLLPFLPGFLWRRQDVFPMFHEVLRGPFPARALPFLAAVLFQRKERKETGFYRWRVRQTAGLSVRRCSSGAVLGTDLLILHMWKTSPVLLQGLN